MTGARYTEAKVSAWWKSGSAVEPSPIQLAAMRWSPLMAEAIAQPTACGNWMPRLPAREKDGAARADRDTLVVEDADQLIGERVRLLRRNVDIGSLDRAGGKPGQITEIGRFVGVGDMLRNVQPQSRPLRLGLARTGSRG